MAPRSVALVLFLIALLVPAGSMAHPYHATLAAGSDLYLPILDTEPAPFRVEVTLNYNQCSGPFGAGCTYPHYYYVSGYVHNLTLTPLYSVTVALDVDWIPYEEPSATAAALAQEHLSVALPAVLPGQAVPFSTYFTLGKGDISNVKARPGTWSRAAADNRTYHALTVVAWSRAGSAVQGRVRNDTTRPLHDVRVVISHPSCESWQSAALTTTLLAPGQETTFSLPQADCSAAELRIISQGASS